MVKDIQLEKDILECKMQIKEYEARVDKCKKEIRKLEKTEEELNRSKREVKRMISEYRSTAKRKSKNLDKESAFGSHYMNELENIIGDAKTVELYDYILKQTRKCSSDIEKKERKIREYERHIEYLRNRLTYLVNSMKGD